MINCETLSTSSMASCSWYHFHLKKNHTSKLRHLSLTKCVHSWCYNVTRVMKPAGEAAILICGKEREGKQWCARLDSLWRGDVLMGRKNGGRRDSEARATEKEMRFKLTQVFRDLHLCMTVTDAFSLFILHNVPSS